MLEANTFPTGEAGRGLLGLGADDTVQFGGLIFPEATTTELDAVTDAEVGEVWLDTDKMQFVRFTSASAYSVITPSDTLTLASPTLTSLTLAESRFGESGMFPATTDIIGSPIPFIVYDASGASSGTYLYHDGSDPITTGSITGITRSGSTATATYVAVITLTDGQPVTIAGANESEYNGVFNITNITGSTFDYTVSGTPATPATGTITYDASIGYLDSTTYVNYSNDADLLPAGGSVQFRPSGEDWYGFDWVESKVSSTANTTLVSKAAAADQQYAVDIELVVFDTDETGNARLDLVFDGTLSEQNITYEAYENRTAVSNFLGRRSQGSTGTISIAPSQASDPLQIGKAYTSCYIRIHGTITASVAGTYSLQWRQLTSKVDRIYVNKATMRLTATND